MDMSASSVSALEMDAKTLSDRSMYIEQPGQPTDVDTLCNASESEQQSEAELAFVDCDSDARSGHSSSGWLFDEALGSAPRAKASHWIPGSNVNPWINRAAPISDQTQVLVVNVVASLLRVPGRALSALLRGVDSGTAKNQKSCRSALPYQA